MPIRFISRTTSRPNVGEPAEHRLVGGRVGPGDVVVVGQGQVARRRARAASAARRASRRCEWPPSAPSSEAIRPAAAARSTSSAVRREREVVGVAARSAGGRTSICSSVAVDRLVARQVATARRRTRTARRRRRPAAAAGRCAAPGSPPATSTGRGRRRPARRSAQGRSLCPSMSGADRSRSTRSRHPAGHGTRSPVQIRQVSATRGIQQARPFDRWFRRTPDIEIIEVIRTQAVTRILLSSDGFSMRDPLGRDGARNSRESTPLAQPRSSLARSLCGSSCTDGSPDRSRAPASQAETTSLSSGISSSSSGAAKKARIHSGSILALPPGRRWRSACSQGSSA